MLLFFWSSEGEGQTLFGSTGNLRHQLITTFQDSPVGGHTGQLGTFRKLSHVFYWPSMRNDQLLCS